MGKQPKISDETLIEYIKKGMKNAQIEKELGAGENCLVSRLRKLRAELPPEENPEPKGPNGIDYGARQAAKLIEEAKVDVEGFMAELKAKTEKPPERLEAALEHCDHHTGSLFDDPLEADEVSELQADESEVIEQEPDPEKVLFRSFEEIVWRQTGETIRQYHECRGAILECLRLSYPIPEPIINKYNELMFNLDTGEVVE